MTEPRYRCLRLGAVAMCAAALTALPSFARDSTAAGSVEETAAVARRHIACFKDWDLDCILADFAKGTTVVTPSGPLRSREEIEGYYRAAFREFAMGGSLFEMEIDEVSDQMAKLSWSAERPFGYPGTGFNNLVIRSGKVVLQSINMKVAYERPRPEPEGSNPREFVDQDGIALFFADDGIYGEDLWRSDGTEAGTRRVTQVMPGVNGADLAGWARFKDQLYFCGCRNFSPGIHEPCRPAIGLWRTNGTEEGTVRVSDVRMQCNANPPFAVTEERMFFVGKDGAGSELWTSDGSTEGTRRVKDIRAGAESSKPGQLFAFEGRVYFQAEDGSGPGLWVSDGTAEGTVKLKNLQGGYSGWHWAFANLRGRLLFTADDGKRGGELWTSDGTARGTRLVKDLNKGKKGSRLFEITELDGIGYFSATDGEEREVFRTDGTPAGTYNFNANPYGSSYPDHMAVSGGRIYFYGSDKSYGGELWMTDGTRDGTRMVKDIFKGRKGSHPNLLVDLDGALVFVAEDDTHGMELWRSDGTEAGTVMLRDIDPGPESGRPRYLARVGDLVFFQADDGEHGVELWATDGTPEGTVLVKNINQMGGG